MKRKTPFIIVALLVAFVALTVSGAGVGQAQSELLLSDFDRTGLETEALALFTAGDVGERTGPVHRRRFPLARLRLQTGRRGGSRRG